MNITAAAWIKKTIKKSVLKNFVASLSLSLLRKNNATQAKKTIKITPTAKVLSIKESKARHMPLNMINI